LAKKEKNGAVSLRKKGTKSYSRQSLKKQSIVRTGIKTQKYKEQAVNQPN
jgi:hypothetical protein